MRTGLVILNPIYEIRNKKNVTIICVTEALEYFIVCTGDVKMKVKKNQAGNSIGNHQGNKVGNDYKKESFDLDNLK